MKSYTSAILIFSLIILFQPIKAQVPVLLGLTSGGGNNSKGSIFSVNGDGSGYSIRYSCTTAGGSQPLGAFIRATNGKYYATAFWDGSSANGTLFTFNTKGNTFTNLYNFDNTNGAHPGANLTEFPGSGKLYGVSQAGGANGYGVIFSFDTLTSTYTKLHDFDLTNGGLSEHCTLILYNGKFYGLASSGGNNSRGVIFSFDPVTNTYAKLYSFSDAVGSYPLGGLILGSNNTFYGMTGNGGANSKGTIFSFNPSGNVFNVLYNFDGINGAKPHGTPIQATNGKLYGTTYDGGTKNFGVLFSFDPLTSTYTKLIDFDGTKGSKPESGVIQASDGRLYGMTHYGGSSNSGTLFTYDIINNFLSVIINFNGVNGGLPFGDVLEIGTTAAIKPVASFQSSDTVFCENSCINFTDKSTNFPTNWEWTFQGATPASSTAKNPQGICYPVSGIYNVKLLAYNSGGKDSVIVNSLIHVNLTPPTPTITHSNDTLYSSTDTAYAVYQWYKNSSIIPGATNSYLVVSSSGNYNVSVTNTAGCSVASGIVLGIQPTSFVMPLCIKSNPVADELFIIGNLAEKKLLKITIYDPLGKTITSSQLIVNEKQISINVKNLVSGLYIVEIQSGDSKWVARFVKE